jgi:putative membrane protein
MSTSDEDGWQRLHPLTIIASLARTVVNAAIPLGVVVLSGDGLSRGGGLIGLVAAGVLALSGLLGWLNWSRIRYRIGEADVRLESGLLSRTARAVPFDRIQDVSLEQKLIPRLLGLVAVKFETGAGGKDELSLSYVSQAEGERLRSSLRAAAEGAPSENVSPQESREEPARLLFAMGPGRLLLFGIFEFSLVAFAALAGSAQQLDSLLPFDVWDLGFWEEQLSGPGAWLSGLGTVARIVGVILAAGAFLILGFATGIARTFLREYGFRLERTARGFRRRRGLLTRSDVVMPAHRVQALVVGTGVLRRIWGWHSLAFVSLAQDAGSAHHVVAPFAQTDMLERIAAEAGFALPAPSQAWQRASEKYRHDRVLLAAGIFVLLALAAITAGYLAAAIGLIVIGLLLAFREYRLWCCERHALDPLQVLSRHGWLSPKLMVASRVKLNSVEIAQGPLARKRGYATLQFGLAGGRLVMRGVPLGEAVVIRAEVLRSLAEVDFARLTG